MKNKYIKPMMLVTGLLMGACAYANSNLVSSPLTHTATNSVTSANQVISTAEFNTILKNNPRLKAKALRDALDGYKWAVARGSVGNKNLLTVIDLSMPSKYKRLWVIDLKSGKTIMNMRVANGKNSGLYRGVRFSNRPGTDMSSLGVYTTDYLFHGDHGLSLKVQGLEKGINNNAFARAIEFHPAWYASPTFVKEHGRVGRSWGCFAVNPAKSKKLFETIKDHTVVFAWAPQETHDPNLTVVA